jgi:hypothetical protein
MKVATSGWLLLPGTILTIARTLGLAVIRIRAAVEASSATSFTPQLAQEALLKLQTARLYKDALRVRPGPRYILQPAEPAFEKPDTMDRGQSRHPTHALYSRPSLTPSQTSESSLFPFSNTFRWSQILLFIVGMFNTKIRLFTSLRPSVHI